jgi:mitochondrial fission protein ELM1
MLRLRGICWVITDHAAGNQRQALALAERLGMPVRHLVLEPQAPWSWLSPRFALGDALALPKSQRHLFVPPWPSVAIGCGRSAALFTRMLRRLSRGTCHTVQILDPRIDPAHWDTVIAPRHDGLTGANVLQTIGSLNPIDEAWLRDGRDASSLLAELPGPRIGVLIGGPRRDIVFDDRYLRQLIEQLTARHRRDGGSLMVLASRRTPPAMMQGLREAFEGIPGLVWNGRDDGRNPYHGVLGWADRLVVTPDSVNMLSEACAVGCAVHTLVIRQLPKRLRQFHQTLRDAGLLHDLQAEAPARQPPLRETAEIAQTLSRRIEASQLKLTQD